MPNIDELWRRIKTQPFKDKFDIAEIDKQTFTEIIAEIISSPVEPEVILQGELLPCPFCGNEAELIEKGNNYTKKRFVTIKCRNKNCRAEMTNGAIRNDMNWLRGISTDAWNKRAGREPKSK